jgi:hypothetical protein
MLTSRKYELVPQLIEENVPLTGVPVPIITLYTPNWLVVGENVSW